MSNLINGMIIDDHYEHCEDCQHSDMEILAMQESLELEREMEAEKQELDQIVENNDKESIIL